VDFSASKATKFNERVALQLRAEFFNLFNHANFSLPNVDFNSAAFGSVTETPDVTAGNPRLGEDGPRVIQLGLKLIFFAYRFWHRVRRNSVQLPPRRGSN